jgi:hypothetical protein
MVRQFYALHVATRARQGLPPPPYAFFQSIHDQLLSRNDGIVFLADHDGKPIAGAIFLYTSDSAVYKFAASEIAGQPLRPNNLLMWEGIQWLRQQGIVRLSLGRTSRQNQGLRRFKRAWGVVEHNVSYLRLRAKDGSVIRASDCSTGFLPALLRPFGPSVLRVIGNRLYKHIG